MSDFYERSTIVHEHLRGKIGVFNKVPIESQDDLSIAYTPGVAGPCLKIAEDGALARELTIKRNTVAIVSDGSAPLMPCGACRQALLEFAPDMRLLLESRDGERIETRLSELLPRSFRPGDLETRDDS